DMPWKGVPMRTLLERVEPLESARFVIAHAEQGFTANLPIEAVTDADVMLAYEADGAPLTAEHGFPLRLLVPSRYFWKSAKSRGRARRRGSDTGCRGSRSRRAPSAAWCRSSTTSTPP